MIKTQHNRAGEIAQWIKVPAAKSDHLSSTPGTHVVEGKNNSQKLLSDLYMQHFTARVSHLAEGLRDLFFLNPFAK